MSLARSPAAAVAALTLATKSSTAASRTPSVSLCAFISPAGRKCAFSVPARASAA